MQKQFLFSLSLSLSLSLCLASLSLTSLAQSPDTTSPVNTFIGTQDDGNTFPGAAAPFGMLQVSPIGEHYSGWR